MKKQLLTVLFTVLLGSSIIQAQCITTSAYGSAIINACPSGSTSITNCNFKGEYSQLTFNITGVFSFNSTSTSTVASFLTLTDAANSVIAFGPAPLQATITTTGGYRLHITDALCGSENVCHTTSYECVLPICSGAPTTGTLSGSSFTICPSSSVSISVTGATQASGITYQWQESTNSGGPFTNVSTGTGATTPAFTTASLSTTMYYQMVITCTASAQSNTTSVVSVYPTNPPTLCYCTTSLGGSVCSGDNITNVTISSTGLNNTSTCNTGPNGTYTQFAPAAGTTATLTAGSTYSISINTTSDNIISVWIDYDRNGIFDASEHTQICLTSTANVATNSTLTITPTALIGQTGMRIRSRLNGNQNGATDACMNFGSGEAEDYIITIDMPTDVHNLPLNSNSLMIYPNPANESISIYTETATSVSKVLIFNALGDLVTENTLNNNKTIINTTSFAAGVYTVKLVNGTNSISKKLVIYK